MNQIYTERNLYNIPYWEKIFLLQSEHAYVSSINTLLIYHINELMESNV